MTALEHAYRLEDWAPRRRGGSQRDAVALARGGDGDAFERLVVLYGPRLHRMLVFRLGDDGEARDVLQEALLAAWQNLERLRDPARFWPWLVGIGLRKAADATRKRRPLPVDGVLAATDAHENDAGGSVDVRGAVNALPDDLRDVVLLRFVLELSEEETAAALAVPRGTVKSRTWRARARLVDLLDGESV